MKVSKVSKKCVAFLLSFTLVFSMFGTFVVTSAASEDDSYVVVKETDGTALSVGETWYDLDTSGVEAGTDFEATAYYIRSDVDANFKAWTRPSDTNFHTTGAYKLVTSDGVVTEGTADTSAFMTIPAGFEGWVLFEKDGFVNCWGGTQVISDYTIDEISQFGVYYSKMDNSQTGGLVVDTCAFVMDVDAFLRASSEDEPTEPDENPTDGYYNSGYLTADNGNVLYFENFDSWTDEYDYVLDFKDMWPDKTPTYDVVTKSGSDRWLKISGYNVWGHKYAADGWMRDGLEANIEDYSGFSMYVKSTDASTFNLIMSMGSSARFSTDATPELKYTLITKTGSQMVAETKYGSGGITLPANFEGWIVLDKAQFAAPTGWPESVGKWSNLPNGDVRYLNFFIPWVQTTGDFYLDNLGFVKDLDAFIKAHSEEVVVPLTADKAGNQIVLENFDKNPSNAYNEAERFILADRSTGNKWWTPTVANESGFSIINSPITPEIRFEGFSMYIETVKDASFALFIDKAGTSFRTITKGNVSYTLIDMDGNYRDVSVKDGYLKIAAGFKGYLVIDKTMFQNAGWGETNLTMQDVKASELTKFYAFLSMGEDGKDTSWKIAIDDICFVQDTTKLRNELIKGTYENTVVEAGVAKGDAYSLVLEDFSEMPLGVLDLFYNGISNGQATEEGGIEIVADADGNKWWKQTKAGYTGFKTAYIAPKSVGTNWDGLAFYVKVDMEEATDASMSLGGVIHTQILNAFPNATSPYTTANFSTQNQSATSSVVYRTIDTERNQQEYQNMGGIQFDNAFEGWIYVDKSILTDTWLDNRPMDTIAAHLVDNFTFGFSQFNQGSVSIRELRLVTDAEGFFTQNAKPADLVYEFEYDEIEIIPAEDFQYIKEHDINMHITITDGYPIYEWHFKGSEIETPADFNPEILFDDDITEINKKHELYGLLEDETARAFLLNAMPGKATLSVNSDLKYDSEQELYLYKYDAKEGTAERFSDEVYVVDEADMIKLTAQEEGIYYLLPTEVPVHEAETGSTEQNHGLTPLQIALIALGAVVVLGSAGVGGFVFWKKQKKSE